MCFCLSGYKGSVFSVQMVDKEVLFFVKNYKKRKSRAKEDEDIRFSL